MYNQAFKRLFKQCHVLAEKHDCVVRPRVCVYVFVCGESDVTSAFIDEGFVRVAQEKTALGFETTFLSWP